MQINITLKQLVAAVLLVGLSAPLAAETAQQRGYYGPGYGPGGQMGGPGMGPGMHRGRPGPGYGPGAGGPSPMGMLGALDLSADQREAINKLMLKQRTLQQQQWNKMQEFQRELAKLYQGDTWDADAITAVYDKMYNQNKVVMKQMIKSRNEIFNTLTAEQREQLKQMQPPAPPVPPAR